VRVARRRVEGWHGAVASDTARGPWTLHERRHHVARVPGVPSQGLNLVEPVMYLSWTGDVPVVYLWGSKTGHRWLTCGFACGSGRAAGSIAGL
jgi:hypothetical protein